MDLLNVGKRERMSLKTVSQHGVTVGLRDKCELITSINAAYRGGHNFFEHPHPGATTIFYGQLVGDLFVDYMPTMHCPKGRLISSVVQNFLRFTNWRSSPSAYR